MTEHSTIWTVGYQGKQIAQLMTELRDAGIECLVDIRRKPMSRKPGFAKKSLSEHLREAGIEYVHIVELGTPPDLFGMRKAKDNAPIFAEYALRYADLMPHVDDLADIASQQRSCLLCFELEHTECHRAVVSRWLTEHNGFTVVNL